MISRKRFPKIAVSKFLAILGNTNENDCSKSNKFLVTNDSAGHKETYIFYLMMMVVTTKDKIS